MFRLVLLFGLLVTTVLNADGTGPLLDDAYEAYSAAELSDTVAARREGFNRALSLYQQLELKDQDGRLLTNIGNCYFQLGEYPWAILYYLRALEVNPRDDRARTNLEIARDYAGLPKEQSSQILPRLLFFHYNYAVGERIGLLFLASCLAIVLWSLSIWKNWRPVRNLRDVVSAVCIVLFLSVAGSYYLTHLDAVIVRSTPLYRDAGTHYAWVYDRPMTAGSVVRITDVQKDGHWFKAKLSDGTIGYLPAEAARIVQR